MEVRLACFLTMFLANKIYSKMHVGGRSANGSYSGSGSGYGSGYGYGGYGELSEHTLVTSSAVFPYAVAVLKKSTYISAGALIDENWVITAADSLFLVRESKRVLRVRLGSVNYRKGGSLLSIKFFEIHPYFSDTKPEFDIALIRLSEPVRLTHSLNPVRLQRRPREVAATHFIVTAWPSAPERTSEELQQLQSMEEIKKRRMLTVSHLHPTDPEKCAEEMEGLDVNATDSMMCLDSAVGTDPCERDTGAPVVLNGVLWGVVSSWKSDDCDAEPGPSFVVLVAAPAVAGWLHATVRGHRWSRQPQRPLSTDDSPEDYDDNFL